VIAVSCPWLNPSQKQEQAWHEQRLAALQAHRQALVDVMRLRDIEARRRFLADYREKWGKVSAEGLEVRVRQAFINLRGTANV
jgi:predicted metal-dependent hydrolase